MSVSPKEFDTFSTAIKLANNVRPVENDRLLMRFSSFYFYNNFFFTQLVLYTR